MMTRFPAERLILLVVVISLGRPAAHALDARPVPLARQQTITSGANSLTIYPVPQSVRDFYPTGRYRIHLKPAGSAGGYCESYVYQDKNRGWAGCIKDMNVAHFWTSFAFKGRVEVVAEFLDSFAAEEEISDEFEIRPLSDRIDFTRIDRHSVRFTLERPGQYWLKNTTGRRHEYPLFVFADPPEKDTPRPDDAGVVEIEPGADYVKLFADVRSIPPDRKVTAYFTPGMHYLGHMENRLRDNMCVYIAAGANVLASIRQDSMRDYAFRGRGILNGGHEDVKWPEGNRGFPRLKSLDNKLDKERIDKSTLNRIKMVSIGKGDNAYLEGLTVINVRGFMLSILHPNRHIDNVKVMAWAHNTDGIYNGHHSVLENSFLKVMDDIMSIYGPDIVVQNVVVYRQVNGNVFRVEKRGGGGHNLERIRIRDVDVIHSESGGSIYHSRGLILMGNSFWQPSNYRNIRFENIQVNTDINMVFAIKAGTINTAGKYRKLHERFQKDTPSRARERWKAERVKPGLKKENPRNVYDVRFRNLVVNGRILQENGLFAEADGSIYDLTFEDCVFNGVPIRSLKDFGTKAGFKVPFYVVGNPELKSIRSIRFIHEGKEFVEADPMADYPTEKEVPDGPPCVKMR